MSTLNVLLPSPIIYSTRVLGVDCKKGQVQAAVRRLAVLRLLYRTVGASKRRHYTFSLQPSHMIHHTSDPLMASSILGFSHVEATAAVELLELEPVYDFLCAGQDTN
jgi:hypothetical protein